MSTAENCVKVPSGKLDVFPCRVLIFLKREYILDPLGDRVGRVFDEVFDRVVGNHAMCAHVMDGDTVVLLLLAISRRKNVRRASCLVLELKVELPAMCRRRSLLSACRMW